MAESADSNRDGLVDGLVPTAVLYSASPTHRLPISGIPADQHSARSSQWYWDQCHRHSPPQVAVGWNCDWSSDIERFLGLNPGGVYRVAKGALGLSWVCGQSVDRCPTRPCCCVNVQTKTWCRKALNGRQFFSLFFTLFSTHLSSYQHLLWAI